MRIASKRLVKAAIPYGAVILYRRYKSRTRSKKSNVQSDRHKRFIELLSTAKILGDNKDPKTIISLTSYGHRIKETAPLSIATLFNQTVLPDKIILWLAYGDKLSHDLKKLRKIGLDVRYTSDTKSYKKLIPTLKEYPESTVIIVDDDMLYPRDWLEKTIATHSLNQKAVVVNRARRIVLRNGRIKPYTEWPLLTEKSADSSHLILANGAGGVLYPPHSLDKKVLDDRLYMKLAPHADDLWFWAMSELKNTPKIMVKDGFSDTIEYELDNSNEKRLSITNADPRNKNNNDTQFANILKQFPELYNNIKNATKQTS